MFDAIFTGYFGIVLYIGVVRGSGLVKRSLITMKPDQLATFGSLALGGNFWSEIPRERRNIYVVFLRFSVGRVEILLAV